MSCTSTVEGLVSRRRRGRNGGQEATTQEPWRTWLRVWVASSYAVRFRDIVQRIFIHRCPRKALGHEQRLDAHTVNYADDFVICCRGTADEAMAAMRDMMQKLMLTVNETKTHVCGMPEETFDFLGYTFGRCYSPKTDRAYIGTKPCPGVPTRAPNPLDSGGTRSSCAPGRANARQRRGQRSSWRPLASCRRGTPRAVAPAVRGKRVRPATRRLIESP